MTDEANAFNIAFNMQMLLILLSMQSIYYSVYQSTWALLAKHPLGFTSVSSIPRV